MASDSPHSFDVVTARSFGDVTITARYVGMLLVDGGVGLVSEPPTDRTEVWTSVLDDQSSLVDGGIYQGIRRLLKV